MFDMKYSRPGALHDLAEKEAGTIMGRDERKALKRAEEAERAFRRSKGYEPDTWRARLWQRFKKEK